MTTLKAIKAEHIARTLKHTNGNKVKTAKILGISTAGLHKLCKTYNIVLVTTKDSYKPRLISVKYSIPMEVVE